MNAPDAPAAFEAVVDTPRGKVRVTAADRSKVVEIRHALLPLPLRFDAATSLELSAALSRAAVVAAFGEGAA